MDQQMVALKELESAATQRGGLGKKRDSAKDAKELYERLGCEQRTHSDRSTFDRCLTAKTYINMMTAAN